MESGVTLNDIKRSFPDEKSDALWTRFVLRPLSFYFAWIFVKLGFSANQVTYLSIGTVVAGSALFFVESYTLGIAAAVFFNVFALLDCVDGNVARATPTRNPYGEWVDALGGYIAYTFVFVSAGVFVEGTEVAPGSIGTVDFLLVGTVAAVTNLLIRVQHQKFDNVREDSKDNPDDQENSLQKEISRNVGITGFLMPVILVGTIFSLLHWILLFYAAFYAAAWVLLTLTKIRHVEQL